MKKLLALLLVLLMAISVAACVPTPDDVTDIVDNAINQNDSDKDDDTTAADDNNDDDSIFDVNNDDDDNNDNDDNNSDIIVNSSIKDQVVYNENDVKVTVTEIGYDGISDTIVTFLVENNSDKNIYVTTDNLTINDYTTTSSLYADVSAGKKAYQDMYLYGTELTETGITAIGKIEFVLEINDSDKYETIDTSDIITLDIDSSVKSTPSSDGEKIYSAGGITIYAEKPVYEDDGYSYYVTRLFVINETNKDISISTDDVSVNGFMVDPFCYLSVPAGKMGYTHMYFYNETLTENRITDIEEVEFILSAYDYNNYDTIFESDPITIKVD